MLRDVSPGDNLSNRKCPKCSCVGNFSGHGGYTRHRVDRDGDSIVEIRRVRCMSCKSTHALIPPDIVPYRIYSAPFIAEIGKRWAKGESNSQIELKMGLPRTSRRRLLQALLGDLCMLFKVAAAGSGIDAEICGSDAADLSRRCLRRLSHALSEHVRFPAPRLWHQSCSTRFT